MAENRFDPDNAVYYAMAVKKSKAYTDSAVANVKEKFEVVASYEDLPSVGDGKTIYLVPTGTNNVYEQYIYDVGSSSYVDIGSTTIDLDEYTTDEELNQRLAPIEEISQSFTVEDGKLCYVPSDDEVQAGDDGEDKPVALDETLQDLVDAVEEISNKVSSSVEATIREVVAEDVPSILAEELPDIVDDELGDVVEQKLPAEVASQISAPTTQAVNAYCAANFSEWSGALDSTLTNSSMAAPADKVGEIKSALSTRDIQENIVFNNVSEVIGKYAFIAYDGWIDSSLKIISFGSAKYIVIPVKSGDVVTKTYREDENFVIVKDFTFNPTLPYVFTLATGETGRRNGVTNLSLPEDAKYILLTVSNNLGTVYFNKSFTINGRDISKTIISSVEDLQEIVNSIKGYSYNLVRSNKKTTVVNNVTITYNGNGTFALSGTANANGGRQTKLTDVFGLSAGTYTISAACDSSPSLYVYVQKSSNDSEIANVSINNKKTFTINDDTNIYIGFNTTNGVTYGTDVKVQIEAGSEKTDFVAPITAVDSVARKNAKDITDIFNDYIEKKSSPYNFDKCLNTIVKHGYTWTQGVCCIGDKMIGFNESADDHTTDGTININSVFVLSNATTVHHNLGHCASADYNRYMDYMMIGNGSVSASVLPIMYLVKNASSWADSPTDIRYNGANVLTIDLSSIGGHGMVCCFGENETIAYVMTIDTSITIFKCLLGIGANDLTSIYPSNSFGTFISGCTDGEYNGTLHVLATYDGSDVTSEIQGLKYLNGFIIMPTDKTVNSTLTAFMSILELDDTENKVYIKDNYWVPVVGTDGAKVRTESEDMFIHDGCGYVMTVSNVNGSYVYRTHKFSLPL